MPVKRADFPFATVEIARGRSIVQPLDVIRGQRQACRTSRWRQKPAPGRKNDLKRLSTGVARTVHKDLKTYKNREKGSAHPKPAIKISSRENFAYRSPHRFAAGGYAKSPPLRRKPSAEGAAHRTLFGRQGLTQGSWSEADRGTQPCFEGLITAKFFRGLTKTKMAVKQLNTIRPTLSILPPGWLEVLRQSPRPSFVGLGEPTQ